ncbi:MAG: hypothetical protein ACK4MF_08995, partial [Hyphomicrobiaceae bacterium]
MADSVGWTIGGLKQLATERLKAADIDAAAGEARRLVATAAGLEPVDLVARPEMPVDTDVVAAVERL